MLRKQLSRLQKQSINLKRIKKKQLKEKQSKKTGTTFSYWRSLTSKRKVTEVFFPIIVAIIVSCLYYIFNNESVNERITLIHSSISTVVAIQIGFIITSLALIASFGERAGEKAFKKIEQKDIYGNMESIIDSFVYNVMVYICLLVLGFIHQFLFEPITPIIFSNFEIHVILKNILKYCYFGIIVFLILHGFVVFMRNVKLIKLYLLSVLKPNEEQKNV